MTATPEIKIGDYVSWKTLDGRAVAKIVGPHGPMPTDGHTDFAEDPTHGVELATAEEITEFERRRAGRIAPIAYE